MWGYFVAYWVFGFAVLMMIFGGQFKIALCQLSVTADKEWNIAHARQAIQEAVGRGAKLVVLPVSCA